MVVGDGLPHIPEELLARASRWAELKRWERRELGQALRALGLSYKEIAELIPAHKGTLSAWCRDIELNAEQRARLVAKRPRLAVRQAVGRSLRLAARTRHEEIRSAARSQAKELARQPLFVAGVVAYWSEGAKTQDVCFSNSDPSLIRLFLIWAQRYLEADASRFTVRMHLHSGQDEAERMRYWSTVTSIRSRSSGRRS